MKTDLFILLIDLEIKDNYYNFIITILIPFPSLVNPTLEIQSILSAYIKCRKRRKEQKGQLPKNKVIMEQKELCKRKTLLFISFFLPKNRYLNFFFS